MDIMSDAMNTFIDTNKHGELAKPI
jgi:hypothetical protein